MDSQIVNAVELLGNPSADPFHASQALEYLNQVRSDPTAWQTCAALFAKTPRASEVVRIVCLEVVNFALHTQGLDAASLVWLKNSLWAYVQQTYGPPGQFEVDPAHLQNKLCQTLTYLFVSQYRSEWPTFIDDFLGLARSSSESPGAQHAVVLYIRVLGSIHDEIADMLLSRQSSDVKRNTELKDQLRTRDMQKISQSWKDILVQYSSQNDYVTELVLRVIGKWVSWMDISLVISQDMLALLLPLVVRTTSSATQDKTREAAVNTLTEICGKKMKSEEKLELISFMNLQEIVSRLVSSGPLNELRNTPQYDSDLPEAVSKLVNIVLADVVRILEDIKASNETKALAHQHIRGLVPFLLRFVSDEFDDVCTSVLPCLTDLLAVLRRLPARPAFYAEILPSILNVVVMKMRYDDSISWGTEDEQTDEAAFQELRKRLQTVQKLIEAVDQNMYIGALTSLVANTFESLDRLGPQMNWRDLDLALHEMYLFGELALPNHGLGAKNQPNKIASERLAVMMEKMCASDIALFPHPAVLLQYMELSVRYCLLFESRQDLIPRVLASFVRLVHNDHARIKTRSWYLFCKLVKSLQAHIGPVAETMINSVQDLLPIKAEVLGDDADNEMSDETDPSADTLFNSQLYLFQAVGCMLSAPQFPPESRALYVRSIVDKLFSNSEGYLTRAKSGDSQALRQVHHIIKALGTLAHGFSGATPGISATIKATTDKEAATEFFRGAEAVLVALGQLNGSPEIREAGRSAFTRLLSVLGAALLPQLPQWIDGLLSDPSPRDEIALFLRVMDQVVYGFKTEIFDVLNTLLSPLIQKILLALSEPVTGTDDEIQLIELRREYLSFIHILLNNSLEQVFVSERNQVSFEPMIVSVLDLAGNLRGNMNQARLAFVVMARVADIWGGPAVAALTDGPTVPPWDTPKPLVPGFDYYLVNRFLPVCWAVLQDADFKPDSDAQSRQLLAEIALVQQTIYTKTGGLFIANLEQQLAPRLGIDPASFMSALTASKDKKRFSTYLATLKNSS